MHSKLWLVVSSIILIILLINPALAQAPPEMPNLKMKCIDATNISEVKTQHFVKLDGIGFDPNAPIEIWRDTAEGFHCAVDMMGTSLCGNSVHNAKDSGKEFQIMDQTVNQVKTDANGEIHLAKVRSRTDARLQHNFYGAQKTAATVDATQLPELTAEEYGLKLLTFVREQQVSSPSGNTNCTTVFFDPYGRVFDALSLEPIADVLVYLQDNNKTNVPNGPGVTNPYLTKADGVFSFFVDDGTYYLKPVVANYSYPLSDSDLLSLETQQTIYTELYQGDPIIQAGAIEHRDIPLNPADSSRPTNTTPVIMNYLITTVTDLGIAKQKISGSVSHPQSIISVYSGSRLVSTITADNNGDFTILIENSVLDQTLPLELIAEKVSLTKSQTLTLETTSSQVLGAKSEAVTLFPQPSFLTGFVYDPSGKIVPFATVEIVIPKMNNQIYRTVRSDTNGFIFIPNSALPPVNYALKIKDQSRQTLATQTVAAFVTLNKSFLEREKVNLLNPQTEHVAKVVQQIKTAGRAYAEKYSQPTPTAIQSPESQKQALPVYILLTVMVVIAIAVLIVYLNKFKQKLP